MSFGIAKQAADSTVIFFDEEGGFTRHLKYAQSFPTRREAIFVARNISSPTLAIDLASNIVERSDGRYQLNCPADEHHMVLVNHKAEC